MENTETIITDTDANNFLSATAELAEHLGVKKEDLARGLQEIIRGRFLISMVNKSGDKTEMLPALSKEEGQARRDEVREMVALKRPAEGIPLYEGKKIHGEAVPFFRAHYNSYIIQGQEVIFAPDLRVIDEKLLLALRNECRNGIPMPIGDRWKKTEAVHSGRFIDESSSIRKALVAMAFRIKKAESVIKTEGKITSQQEDDVSNSEPLSKKEVQARRDQVRIMAAQGKPLEGIPLYEGKNKHEEAIKFFKTNYADYIVTGYETIFATDLANIDDRLLRAIRNECRGGTLSPIGTASDLSKALVEGRFLDGKNTSARVAGARWRQKNLLKEVKFLSKEEVQARRDQVREMVAKEAPIEEIPLYMGKRVHGEAVPFFRAHYNSYIIQGQEVIFAPELMQIDRSLLLALRNECRTSACLIPIGTASDKTDALIQARFVDGKHSLRSARATASVRAFRERQETKEGD